MGNITEFFPILINAFFVIQIVTAGAMCIYGYKWRKGLIATLSIYIGIAIGIAIAAAIIRQSYNNITFALILIPIVAVIFYSLAYKWIPLNHFLTGFLVGNKLAFMIIYNLMKSSAVKFDFTILMVLPIVIGLIAGFVLCSIFTHVAVLVCLVYIGSVELVSGIFDIINKSLFVATGNISFIFNIEDILLKIVGVEVPSFLEMVVIIIVGIASFILQKNLMERDGINLSDRIVDDRN